jgi:hypothetical protein
MAYDSEWQRLSDAVMRVMKTCGQSKDEAQTDLCRAIADGTVKVRGKLKRHTTKGVTASGTVLEGTDFEIPPEIKPEDLDWESSRPVKPWAVRRGSFEVPGYWDLEWIKVSRTAVTNVLCAVKERGEQHASCETRAQVQAGRRLKARRCPLALIQDQPPGRENQV